MATVKKINGLTPRQHRLMEMVHQGYEAKIPFSDPKVSRTGCLTTVILRKQGWPRETAGLVTVRQLLAKGLMRKEQIDGHRHFRLTEAGQAHLLQQAGV